MKTRSPMQQLVVIERLLRKDLRIKLKQQKVAERRLDAFLKARDAGRKKAVRILESTMQEIKH